MSLGSNPTQGLDLSAFVVSCAVLSVGGGLVAGWSLAQAVLQTLYEMQISELILSGQRPQGGSTILSRSYHIVLNGI
jgi:hypothetical protein